MADDSLRARGGFAVRKDSGTVDIVYLFRRASHPLVPRRTCFIAFRTAATISAVASSGSTSRAAMTTVPQIGPYSDSGPDYSGLNAFMFCVCGLIPRSHIDGHNLVIKNARNRKAQKLVGPLS